MGAEQYKVYFRGEIIQGYTIAQLKRNLATLFKLPHEKIEKMFIGQTVIVQPAVNKQTALQYQRAFEQAGGICHIELVSPSTPKTAPQKYHVVFYGDIAEGESLEEVQRKVSSMFHMTPQKVKQAFSGHPFLVKEGIDHQTALKYKAAFEQAGTVCCIEAVTPPAAKASNEQNPTRNSSSQPTTMTCPKCGFTQKTVPVCRRCGIVIERFKQLQQQELWNSAREEEISPQEIQSHRLVEQIVKHYSDRIKDDRIFFTPNLPPKQLENALRKARAKQIDHQDVLVLIDNSILENGKDGVFLTATSIYGYKTDVKTLRQQFEFSGIQSVACRDFEGSPAFGMVGLAANLVARSITSELHLNGSRFFVFEQLKKQSILLFAEMLENICQAVKNPMAYKFPTRPSIRPILTKPGKPSDSPVDIIKSYKTKIKSTLFFFKVDGIPPKKVENAIKAYASRIKFGDVLLLIDNTVFGNAKNGAILTANTLYVKDINIRAQKFQFDTIESVNFVEGILNDSIQINDVEAVSIAVAERVSSRYFTEMLREICGLSGLSADASVEKLKELKDLYDTGVITEEEFLQKREKYLDQL